MNKVLANNGVAIMVVPSIQVMDGDRQLNFVVPQHHVDVVRVLAHSQQAVQAIKFIRAEYNRSYENEGVQDAMVADARIGLKAAKDVVDALRELEGRHDDPFRIR